MRRGQKGSWPADEGEGFLKPREEQMYSYKMQRDKDFFSDRKIHTEIRSSADVETPNQ